MQDCGLSGVVRIRQAANGGLFGVHSDGVVVRLGGIRGLTQTSRHAVDFDSVDVDAVYVPSRSPPFPIHDLTPSDDGRCVVLHGQSAFGVVQLDRKIESRVTGEFEVPIQLHEACDEVEVLRVRWFPGETRSFCVLKSDGTISVYEAGKGFPERVYRLKRNVRQGIGIEEARTARLVDFVFLPESAWGQFCAMVLYEDGTVFALCPILPTGEVAQSLLRAAARRPIEREVLKGLLMEVMGQDLDTVPQHVPLMQGPLNAGLGSQWEDTFAQRQCDRACEIIAAGCAHGCITVTIGTVHGILYSHAMVEDIVPQIVPHSKAVVTPMGVRMCPWLESSGAKMHLMEIIELQRRPRKKLELQSWQESGHPEMTYCSFGQDVLRLRWMWVVAVLSGESVEPISEKCDIWRFSHEAAFLGSFHELDTSIAVFRHGSHTSASIFRPKLLPDSFVELLPDMSGGSISESDIQQAVAELDKPEYASLKAAFEKYEYQTLDGDDFDLSLERLEDQASSLKDQISELTSLLHGLNPQTTKTVQSMHAFNAAPWLGNSVHSDFQRIHGQLNEITRAPPDAEQ